MADDVRVAAWQPASLRGCVIACVRAVALVWFGLVWLGLTENEFETVSCTLPETVWISMTPRETTPTSISPVDVDAFKIPKLSTRSSPVSGSCSVTFMRFTLQS